MKYFNLLKIKSLTWTPSTSVSKKPGVPVVPLQLSHRCWIIRLDLRWPVVCDASWWGPLHHLRVHLRLAPTWWQNMTKVDTRPSKGTLRALSINLSCSDLREERGIRIIQSVIRVSVVTVQLNSTSSVYFVKWGTVTLVPQHEEWHCTIKYALDILGLHHQVALLNCWKKSTNTMKRWLEGYSYVCWCLIFT